jgi:hypothetical protein
MTDFPREICTRGYDNGWVVVNPRAGSLTLSVGRRGEGHDEMSTYHSTNLSLEDAVRLILAIEDALREVAS